MASLNPSASRNANRSFRNPAGVGAQSIRGSGPQTVTFARRTASGRYVSLSREDLDLSGEMGDEYMNYTVHIPPTPDNQPMTVPVDPSIAAKAEEQYVSNSLFTGGFNSVTRAHLMDKVIDSEASHPQMAGAKGSACAVEGCDGKVMRNERGEDVVPCECGFKICRECYFDAQKDGGICPGCKESYKIGDLDEPNEAFHNALPLPPAPSSKMERRLSLMKSSKSLLMRSQTGDFDHNRWLFETKGTYGYGNAFWPKEAYTDSTDGGMAGNLAELNDKPWKPLTRKLKIPAGILSPYRGGTLVSVLIG